MKVLDLQSNVAQAVDPPRASAQVHRACRVGLREPVFSVESHGRSHGVTQGTVQYGMAWCTVLGERRREPYTRPSSSSLA